MEDCDENDWDYFEPEHPSVWTDRNGEFAILTQISPEKVEIEYKGKTTVFVKPGGTLPVFHFLFQHGFNCLGEL